MPRRIDALLGHNGACTSAHAQDAVQSGFTVVRMSSSSPWASLEFPPSRTRIMTGRSPARVRAVSGTSKDRCRADASVSRISS